MLKDEGFLGVSIIYITQGDLVGQRCTRGAVAGHFDAVGTQNLLGARNAALATAGSHTHAGGVLEFINRYVLAVADHSEQGLHVHILTVADEGFAFLRIGEGSQVQRLGIALLEDEALHLIQVIHLGRLYASHIGLVVFLENLLDDALAHLGAIVIHQEDFLALFHLIFHGQVDHILALVVAENGQTRAVVHTLHTADALVIIDDGHRRCGGLGDGTLRTCEGTGIAGEAVEAVDLHIGFQRHALIIGDAGLVEQTHRALLRVDILAGNFQIVLIGEAEAQFLSHLIGHLLATEHGTGALADTNGITGAIHVAAEYRASLHEQLVIGNQTGADVDDVDVVNHLLGARDGLEILALGNHGARDSGVVLVGNRADEHVRRHDGDTQTAHAVGLHGETALVVHTLDDGLDGCASLHGLIAGEVADVAGTHGEHALAQQGVLLVHHLLEDGSSVNTGHVIVLEHRHERHGTRGHYQMVGIDVAHLLGDDILQGNTPALEQIPHGVVEQDAVMVVAGECLGDVKTAHTTELLLLLEEEELMGLHIELTTLGRVVVHHDIGDSQCRELLAASQSGRAAADDGDRGLVNPGLAGCTGLALGHVVLRNLAHLFHAVNAGDADAAHLTVNKHFTCTALADTALQTAVAARGAVAVHN